MDDEKTRILHSQTCAPKGGQRWAHLPLYTVYRVTKVLIGGDEEGEGDEEDDRRLVVQPKDIVVDAVAVELDQTTHRAEHVVHHLGNRPLSGSAELGSDQRSKSSSTQ